MSQINSVIGDFSGNRNKILSQVEIAKQKGTDLIIFPEMALCGYPPMDLLDHQAFVEENLTSLGILQRNIPPDIAVVVGYVDKNRLTSGKPFQNVAAVIYNNEIIHTQAKSLLPTYDVFDESRYFEPARYRQTFTLKNKRIGIAICEDVWWEAPPHPGIRYSVDPITDLLDTGATTLIVPSASPYHLGKVQNRHALLSKIGKSSGVPIFYVNMVGGNDSLVFDGNSFSVSSQGEIVSQANSFSEDQCFVELYQDNVSKDLSQTGITKKTASFYSSSHQEMLDALVYGLQDYIVKCGFQKVHLGLSGGIDSALVAYIAVQAVSSENVHVFLMPSQYSSEESKKDAIKLCENLNISYTIIEIEDIFRSYTESLSTVFKGQKPGITEENIQARIRGTLLMAYSNKMNSLLLATGNKSELATGYCTLYGDMAGGIAVIGDILKTDVFALASIINRNTEIIPYQIIQKPPSAELRPDQKDSDSLPPYDILDRILTLYLLENMTSEEIIARGYGADLVHKILKMVSRAEYKRRQAPPVLKVSPRAFGTGRRIPIARNIYEI